jgi:hypothetical protein
VQILDAGKERLSRVKVTSGSSGVESDVDYDSCSFMPLHILRNQRSCGSREVKRCRLSRPPPTRSKEGYLPRTISTSLLAVFCSSVTLFRAIFRKRFIALQLEDAIISPVPDSLLVP